MVNDASWSLVDRLMRLPPGSIQRKQDDQRLVSGTLSFPDCTISKLATTVAVMQNKATRLNGSALNAAPEIKEKRATPGETSSPNKQPSRTNRNWRVLTGCWYKVQDKWRIFIRNNYGNAALTNDFFSKSNLHLHLVNWPLDELLNWKWQLSKDNNENSTRKMRSRRSRDSVRHAVVRCGENEFHSFSDFIRPS